MEEEAHNRILVGVGPVQERCTWLLSWVWTPFTKVNAFVFTMQSIWFINWKEKSRPVK